MKQVSGVTLISLGVLILSFQGGLFAQVKVHPNNHVIVGNLGSVAPGNEFTVWADSYLKCTPASSGVHVKNYANQYEPGGGTGSTTYNDPAIIGQWGNALWLGTAATPLWQVRSFEVWANNVLVSSDSNFKTNIEPLDSALQGIMALNPVTYDHSAGITDSTPGYRADQIIEVGTNSTGLLAQELFEVYPHLVHNNGNNELAIDYIALIPILIKAIQEQQAKIEELESLISP